MAVIGEWVFGVTYNEDGSVLLRPGRVVRLETLTIEEEDGKPRNEHRTVLEWLADGLRREAFAEVERIHQHDAFGAQVIEAYDLEDRGYRYFQREKTTATKEG